MDTSERQQPRVAVLGPVLVEDRSGKLAEPSGSLGKSLIVALVLARGSVSVPSLVEDLWDDAPPRQERAALQTLVSRVRTASADGILEFTPSGYALALEPDRTDLGLAKSLLARARLAESSGDPARAENDATAALALWRGEPGSELGGSPLASELARTARGLQSELRLLRARSRRALGDVVAALADLEPLVEESPLDEGLERELLLTLDAAGRRNDAILSFDAFRTRLRDAVGTRPGPELVALNASLLVEPEQPAPSPQSRVRIGMRTSPNALIGREYDLDAVEDLIATGRLTTILGAGGLGKTRLAQEIGRRAQTHAVIVVELASVRSGDDIGLALASTLGIREARSMRLTADPIARVDLRSRILGILAERETLLIVDNCEHIVDAAAAWIADILESTSGVHVLATSRAPLAIAGERVYQLGSLPSGLSPTDIVPDTEAPLDTSGLGPAVALFVERARGARPTVVLPLDVVVGLCDRLDGLPLAIELAAARTRSMSVEEIERRLSNRFTLLTGGERTAPERHRTLLAVIDWSWNLLGSSERSLLRRLSRFPDGFSAEAAEAVSDNDDANRVVDDLDALVNQSLVSVSEDRTTGILRYRMLETVREFGELALIEAGEVRLVDEAMFEWAARFAHEAIGNMHGAQQVHRFQLVTSEQDNLVTVLRSAIDQRRPDVVATIFAALAYYWSIRGAHSEVLAFAPSVMGVLREFEPTDEQRTDAAAAYAIIGATMLFVDIRVAVRALSRLRKVKQGVVLADSRLEALTNLIQAAGRPATGMAMLATYQASEDPSIAAMANLLAAQFKENSGELEESMQVALLAYEMASRHSDTWAQAAAAQALAQLHGELARPAEALEWAERARIGLSALQADGDVRQLDWMIAMNSVAVGDLERGRELLQQLATADDESLGFDYLDLRAIGRAGLAEIAIASGDVDDGLRQYRDAIKVFEVGGVAPTPWMNILAAAAIIAHVRAETPDSHLVDRLALDLRTRVRVTIRLQPMNVDKPVLGACALGLATWLLWERGDAEPSGPQIAAGLELFGLATRMNSRQDLRPLNRQPLEHAFRESYGDEAVDRALETASSLSLTEASDRFVELISLPSLPAA